MLAAASRVRRITGTVMESGASAQVTHDIVVNDQLVFKAGDAVIVETVSPNNQHPEYKYVVTSALTGARFQLSDADLRESAPMGTAAAVVPPQIPPGSQANIGMSQIGNTRQNKLAPSPQQPPLTHPIDDGTGTTGKPGVALHAPPSRTKRGGRRALLVIVITLVVCLLGAGGYAAYHFLSRKVPSTATIPTQEQFAKQHEVSQKAAAMYYDQVATKGTTGAASSTVAWLKKQETVKDAGVGSGCIWGVYKDGTEFTINTTDPFVNN